MTDSEVDPDNSSDLVAAMAMAQTALVHAEVMKTRAAAEEARRVAAARPKPKYRGTTVKAPGPDPSKPANTWTRREEKAALRESKRLQDERIYGPGGIKAWREEQYGPKSFWDKLREWI